MHPGGLRGPRHGRDLRDRLVPRSGGKRQRGRLVRLAVRRNRAFAHRRPREAGNGKVELTLDASPDTTLVEIRRADKLVYSGADKGFTDTRLQNGVQYRYTPEGL